MKTYTCTFRTSTLADGDCGKKRTERAIRPATLKATVVKKPKTFCTRTREECMLEMTPWEGGDVLLQGRAAVCGIIRSYIASALWVPRRRTKARSTPRESMKRSSEQIPISNTQNHNQSTQCDAQIACMLCIIYNRNHQRQG